jgi:predicted nucleotide-binding protein
MVGALPIAHTTLRSVPILLIHGHDRMALLELQNLLYAKFPFVMPRVMVSEQLGSLGMSEKFERITGDLVGAIALVTPDDRASAARDLSSVANRARQNVVMEIGWVWGKLGRQRCLLLKRGDVEMPSDLAGVDVQTFNQTPGECITAVHGFIEHLTASREA